MKIDVRWNSYDKPGAFFTTYKIMMFIALTYIISYKFFSGKLAIILLRCTLRCLISIHVEINGTTDICFGMNEINESYGEEYNTTQYNGEENNGGSFVEWDAKSKNIFLWTIVAQILGTVNVYFETLILFCSARNMIAWIRLSIRQVWWAQSLVFFFLSFGWM